MTTFTLPILLVLLFSSFVGSYLLFPKIIAIAQFKRLIASPNGRSSHLTQIPNIGGLVFFIALIFGLYLSNEWDTDDAALTLITGMMVLFFVGLKDDLMVISAKTKFFSQLGAILLILYNPAFQVQTLNGFLGIQEIPLWLGIPFSAFVMLSIINSFNFIDGIDGLAGFVAMIILGFFGILFYAMGFYMFVGLIAVMIGSLIAFLRYNLSLDLKIFMGDTGSLLLGFLIASAAIRLFALTPQDLELLPLPAENLYLVILAILIIPFVDSIRVTWIRLSKGKSPFTADRNHVHHILIDNFHFSHLYASLLLATFNLIFGSLFMLMSMEVGTLAQFIFFAGSTGILILIFKPSNFSPKTDLEREEFERMIDEVRLRNESYRAKVKNT